MKTLILVFFLSALVCLSACSGFDNQHENLLANSKWELYGYKDANLIEVLPLTDTLEFGAVPDYRYNKGQQKYNIYDSGTSSQALRLQLHNTRFGTVMG